MTPTVSKVLHQQAIASKLSVSGLGC